MTISDIKQATYAVWYSTYCESKAAGCWNNNKTYKRSFKTSEITGSTVCYT